MRGCLGSAEGAMQELAGIFASRWLLAAGSGCGAGDPRGRRAPRSCPSDPTPRLAALCSPLQHPMHEAQDAL